MAQDPKSSSALLDHVKSGTFPDSDLAATAEVFPSLLSQLQDGLRTARSEVQDSVRKASRDSAADVDSWITQAKKIQADIERSKVTAREIVEHATENASLRSAATDAEAKLDLLEREISFNQALQDALSAFREAARIVAEARENITSGRLHPALKQLHDADNILSRLGQYESTNIYALVQNRLTSANAALIESTTELADRMVQTDAERHSITIQAPRDQSEESLDRLVEILIARQCFEPWVERLQRRIKHATFDIFTSMKNRNGGGVEIEKSADTLTFHIEPRGHVNEPDTIQNVGCLVEFLHRRLPPAVAAHFSNSIMPDFSARFEHACLNSRVPVNTTRLSDFESLLGEVSELGSNLTRLGWQGQEQLDIWVESAPKTWLSRQRAHALGQLRPLLLRGVQDLKTVERVVKLEGHVTSDDRADESHDDAWDDNWSDNAGKPGTAPASPTKAAAADDEVDASAWDMDDDSHEEVVDDAEAWGWDDDDDKGGSKTETPARPTKIARTTSPIKQPDRQPVREALTITSVPDGVLETVIDTFKTAHLLSKDEYAGSPIASAVSALWNIPTLVLAMYRATATSVYGRVSTGNLLAYNDSTWLAERLQAILSDPPSTDVDQNGQQKSTTLVLRPAVKSRLESECKALIQFAKRAYSTELDSQRTILTDHLDDAQGFTNCTSNPNAQECASAIAMTVGRIRAVHTEWAAILSPTQLRSTIGALVAGVLARFVADVLEQSDIGEEESRRLKVYADELGTLRDLFVVVDDVGRNGNGKVRSSALQHGGRGDQQQQQQQEQEQEQQHETGLYVPNWLRFSYLGEVLECSLADIKYLWTEGELGLEFQSDEIVDLIMALFADSELRRKAIAEIRRR